jgi:hypothetical protein
MISRFAQSENIFSGAFEAINKRLLAITDEDELIDHRDVVW